jgi:accessory gene regulator B
MIEKLAVQLTAFICTEEHNNPKDRAKIQYGLNILLSEGFKIISLILIFLIINYENYFYFSLLILMTIRPFAGGVHIKGALNCLLLTILIFLFTSVIGTSTPKLHIAYYLSASILSLLILLVRAPICSVQRPIKDSKKKLYYKITAILATLIWSIVLLCLKSPSYVNCGFSTILLQNIQLVLVKKPKS